MSAFCCGRPWPPAKIGALDRPPGQYVHICGAELLWDGEWHLVDDATVCAADDCRRPIKARGLCQMHYDRQRSKGRMREDRVLFNRARNRATAALVQAHKDEFTSLLEQAEKDVHEEHERLLRAAEESGTKVAGTVRLRPGRPGRDQSVEHRIQGRE